MYLFDDVGLMKRPEKHVLMKEMERNLQPDDYVHPKHWPVQKTAYVIDVMQILRKISTKSMNTFGDFLDKRFGPIISAQCTHASRIDFVFDSYPRGSIKDSEHERRNSHNTIEISTIDFYSPLPKDMNTFWSSPHNKRKIQIASRYWICIHSESHFNDIKLFLSATAVTEDYNQQCNIVNDGIAEMYEELSFSHIEEADVRIIPHVLDSIHSDKCQRVVMMSNDTDVAVLCIHFFKTMQYCAQFGELWIRGGIGESVRYIPIHTLAIRMGWPLCEELPAMHALTGCDTTSNVGTKPAALKANPAAYLKDFEEV